MTEHPNEQDMANKRERDEAYRAEQVDALIERFSVPFEAPPPTEGEVIPAYIERVISAVRAYVNGEPA